MVLEIPPERLKIDVGKADVYTGADYQHPYFFETAYAKMMKDDRENCVDIKTWKGEFFQFSIDCFHQKPCLLVTSTLGDCAFFSLKRLSIERSMSWAKEHSEKKHAIKNSYTGYFTFGKRLIAQYEDLKKHMEEQEIYFSDETLEKVYLELKRRTKR